MMAMILRKLGRRASMLSAATPAMHMVQLPPMVRTSSRLFIAALILSGLALLLLPWQQTSVAHGRVIAYAPQERDQVIEAPLKGRIIKWHVQEGQEVSEGDLLVEMADNDPELMKRLIEQRDAVEAQRAAAASAATELERQIESIKQVRELTLDAMDAKIQMANFEVRAAKQTLDGAEGRERAARLNFDRKKKLAASGLSSQRDLELAEAKAVETRAKVLSARAKLAEKRSKVLSLKAERSGKASDFDAKLAEKRSKLEDKRGKLAKTREALAKAEVKLSQQRQMEIRAPRAGVILEINAREGSEYVKPGEQLALLVPSTESRAVELWISGNDAPLVEPGRHVRLQFEGWPAVQFSGWPSVAVGTFGGVVSFVDARAEDTGLFRVVVVPDHDDQEWPSAHILRQGARANGWVLLNEVALGYELWRQINGFPPALPEEVMLSGESGKYGPASGKKKMGGSSKKKKGGKK